MKFRPAVLLAAVPALVLALLLVGFWSIAAWAPFMAFSSGRIDFSALVVYSALFPFLALMEPMFPLFNDFEQVVSTVLLLCYGLGLIGATAVFLTLFLLNRRPHWLLWANGPALLYGLTGLVLIAGSE
jgi:hypothetical protein